MSNEEVLRKTTGWTSLGGKLPADWAERQTRPSLIRGLVDDYIRNVFQMSGRSLSPPAARAELLSGALLYVYRPGSKTPARVYLDESMSAPESNPVCFDAMGEVCEIFGDTSRFEIRGDDGQLVAIFDFASPADL